MAAVPDHVAARLNGDLTPLGAERDPSTSGEVQSWPDNSYNWVFEPISLTITAANASQHLDKLTATHRALLAAHPDTYQMPVFPTHRTCRFPTNVEVATQANAKTGRLAEGGNGVRNASIGVPFPIPNSAYEIIWNHLLTFRGHKVSRQLAMSAPNDLGVQTLSVYWDYDFSPWVGLNSDELEFYSSKFRLRRTEFVAPSTYAGHLLLEHQSLDEEAQPSVQWEYRPGTRRVPRAPNASFGHPLPFVSDIVSYDSRNGFDGSPKQYDWTLIGRGQYYLPNNNDKLGSSHRTYDEVVSENHLTQSLARYELQTVWVIEAKLKSEFEHRFHRRRFYLQEDSWRILATELYNAENHLVSGQELFPSTNRSESRRCEIAAETTYDLLNERFAVRGLSNREADPTYDDRRALGCDLSPAAMRSMHGCRRKR